MKSNILQVGKAPKITNKKDSNASNNYIEYNLVK